MPEAITLEKAMPILILRTNQALSFCNALETQFEKEIEPIRYWLSPSAKSKLWTWKLNWDGKDEGGKKSDRHYDHHVEEMNKAWGETLMAQTDSNSVELETTISTLRDEFKILAELLEAVKTDRTKMPLLLQCFGHVIGTQRSVESLLNLS
jgi:hypothetical protein